MTQRCCLLASTRSVESLLNHAPVGERHALEELRQRGVDGEMRRAGLPEAVGLAGLFVDGVEVVALLRRVLGVRGGHHEVPAVDDLLVGSPEGNRRLLCVRVVVLLLLDHQPRLSSRHD